MATEDENKSIFEKALDALTSKDEEASVESTEEEKKSIFQKMLDALTSKDEKAAFEKAQKELEERKKQLAAAQAAAAQAQAHVQAHVPSQATSTQAQSIAQKTMEEAKKRAAEAEARAKAQEDRIRQMIEAKQLAAQREAYFASLQKKVIAEHTVGDRDTLSHLALKYYGHATKPYWMVIYEANKDLIGKNPNRVKVGAKLKIPELPAELKKD